MVANGAGGAYTFASPRTRCYGALVERLHRNKILHKIVPDLPHPPHSVTNPVAVNVLKLFIRAIKNTELFPPRCGKLPVPLETCRAVLPKALVEKFDLKVERVVTLDPTCCSDAACSSFIRPKDIKAEIGACAACKIKTCVRCKCAEHQGLCPSDPHVQLLMDAAKRSLWQQCTKCKNMVELSSDCFHMIFCCLCGIKWKGCRCPGPNEDYLTRPLPVAAAVTLPVTPHEHGLRHVNGEDCQGCGADFLHFVLRYSGCDITNYWRCFHNLE